MCLDRWVYWSTGSNSWVISYKTWDLFDIELIKKENPDFDHPLSQNCLQPIGSNQVDWLDRFFQIFAQF